MIFFLPLLHPVRIQHAVSDVPQRLKWQSEEGNSSRKVAQVEDEHKEIISRVEKLPELAIHLDKQVLQVVKDFLW